MWWQIHNNNNMASISTLYRASSPAFYTTTRIITNNRIGWSGVWNKRSSIVLYFSSPSSGYHTRTRAIYRHEPKHKFSQFSTTFIHRNNSYFSSVLQKAFIVKAEESFPGTEISSQSSHVNTGVEAPIGSVPEATGNGSETILETSTTTEVFETATVSSPNIDSLIDSITYIPPPPAPPEPVVLPLNALGEPTLESVGLGGWSPVGIIQNCLEYLHVTFDLPWWGAIAVATVCIRMMVFPLVLLAQRNAAKMNNNLPQLQLLQMKLTEARQSGNQMEAARLTQEMMLFMKEKELSPMKNMCVPLAQAPIFISMFMGLRGMANLPLESFKEGGIYWFVDLTLADPYYLLPICTAATLLATIELGTDGVRVNSSMQNMRWFLRALPLVVFPFTVNFPAAVLCYWVSTNLFSLVQVGFLKIPAVRDHFKIPKMTVHKPETLPKKSKGVVAGFKESWSNMKISKELEERERYDEMRFKQAGMGPVVRTFKHDPTKKVINVQAKEKR